jgi:apolipoprotein N-acyltransferase
MTNTNASKAIALLLCTLSAVLYFLTFIDFGMYPLIWFCLVPVLVAIRDTTPRRALWLGTLFGTVTNLGGYYWVIHTIQTFGNMPAIVATLGYVLLCIYQGFLLAVVIALVRHAQRSLAVAPVWSLAVAFPAIELLYPLLFPSYIGNSQLEFSTITQFVDITGMAGLTVLIALVNGAVFELVDARLQSRRIHAARVAVPTAAFIACTIYGLVRLPQIDTKSAAAPTLKVGLVQTNIGAKDKAANRDEFVRQHQAMSHALIEAHPDVALVVWPESAYNQPLLRSQTNVRADVMQGIDRPLLFGVLTYNGVRDGVVVDLHNSLLLASATGEIVSRYDKIDLLAFGETYPFSKSLPVLAHVFGSNWFTRGVSLEPLRFGDTTLLPTICFEDVLPSLVRELWNGGGPADVLVNGTNDSWYGDTIQPMEHLALAAFRSIETRRALIRSTNTGISAIVDPAGRIVQRTGQWQRETLVAEVPLIKDGSTTLFMRFGNVVGWLCVALTVIGIWRCRQAAERRN